MKSKYKQLSNAYKEKIIGNSSRKIVCARLLNAEFNSQAAAHLLKDTKSGLSLSLTFRFTLTVKTAAPSIAGTNQSIAQVCPLPLLVYLIVFSIVITTSCK
jgi:hypothetical protein